MNTTKLNEELLDFTKMCGLKFPELDLSLDQLKRLLEGYREHGGHLCHYLEDCDAFNEDEALQITEKIKWSLQHHLVLESAISEPDEKSWARFNRKIDELDTPFDNWIRILRIAWLESEIERRQS